MEWSFDVKKFRKRLVEVRKKLPKGENTQEKVSEAVGIPEKTIRNMEDSTNSPSFEKVAKLAKHYGVSLDYLAGMTDFRTKDEDTRSLESYGFTAEAAKRILALDKNQIAALSKLLEFDVMGEMLGRLYEYLHWSLAVNLVRYKANFKQPGLLLDRARRLEFDISGIDGEELVNWCEVCLKGMDEDVKIDFPYGISEQTNLNRIRGELLKRSVNFCFDSLVTELYASVASVVLDAEKDEELKLSPEQEKEIGVVLLDDDCIDLIAT